MVNFKRSLWLMWTKWLISYFIIINWCFRVLRIAPLITGFCFRTCSNSSCRQFFPAFALSSRKLDISQYKEPALETIICTQKAALSTVYFKPFANGFVIASVCIIIQHEMLNLLMISWNKWRQARWVTGGLNVCFSYLIFWLLDYKQHRTAAIKREEFPKSKDLWIMCSK